ncbi:unnamed protein product [Paramecium primaurelia]|uniref:Transmembrane protein n=1 Tax=Paramecium primaurelia TaxID=5886 RepID=A0A8S1KEU2_PARPR|nr:unnamed protein product [Paramecium primaurelia]
MPNVKQYKSDSQIPQINTFTILCKISPINPPDTPKEIQTFKLSKDQQNQKQVQQSAKLNLKQDDSFMKKNENQYSEKYKRRKPILVIRHSKSLSCIKKEKSVHFHLEKDESSFQFFIFQNWIQKEKKIMNKYVLQSKSVRMQLQTLMELRKFLKKFIKNMSLKSISNFLFEFTCYQISIITIIYLFLRSYLDYFILLNCCCIQIIKIKEIINNIQLSNLLNIIKIKNFFKQIMNYHLQVILYQDIYTKNIQQ